MSVFSDILTMTIYRPPTCHIQPAPLPTFPQPCLFGYTSAVLSVLWAVNFIHSPNGVLREAFQGVTLSFHFSDYQLSWCAFSYCTPVTAFVTFSSCFIAVTYRSRMLSMFGSTCLALTFSARLASPATISVWISLGLVLMLW